MNEPTPTRPIKPVVIIGLDGATLDLIEPWAEEVCVNNGGVYDECAYPIDCNQGRHGNRGERDCDEACRQVCAFEFIDSISLTMNKAEYVVGEEIVFTINNNTDRTIYYSYGCSWPQPYLIMNGESYTLTTNIYEVVPPIKEIKPEESEICIWNQKAWFNPYKKPPEKYSDNLKEGLVPSGEYQLRFNYYLSEDDVYSNRNMRSVYSQVIETVLI